MCTPTEDTSDDRIDSWYDVFKQSAGVFKPATANEIFHKNFIM
jgi:hypothetical protein